MSTRPIVRVAALFCFLGLAAPSLSWSDESPATPPAKKAAPKKAPPPKSRPAAKKPAPKKRKAAKPAPKPAVDSPTKADRDAIDAWIEENENDPASVEMISLEGPKRHGENRMLLAKYRAKNKFGALAVRRLAFSIRPDGTTRPYPYLDEAVHARWFADLPGWNDAERPSKLQNAFGDAVNQPIKSDF